MAIPTDHQHHPKSPGTGMDHQKRIRRGRSQRRGSGSNSSINSFEQQEPSSSSSLLVNGANGGGRRGRDRADSQGSWSDAPSSSSSSSSSSTTTTTRTTTSSSSDEMVQASAAPSRRLPTLTPSPHQQQRRRKRNNNNNTNTSKQSKKSSSSLSVVVPEVTAEEKSQYIAMDCEMVGVGEYGQSSALARVTLVNWDGETVFDGYIRPDQDVTDYRTYVSGITESDLAHGMTLEECRTQVANLLRGKVLVGHGLKNDLRVMQLSHPWEQTRDTAKYDPLMKIRFDDGVLWPRKLKDLVLEKLQRDIQLPGIPHSPIEDAIAAMDLYKHVRCKFEKVMEYKIKKTQEIMSSSTTTTSSTSTTISRKNNMLRKMSGPTGAGVGTKPNSDKSTNNNNTTTRPSFLSVASSAVAAY